MASFLVLAPNQGGTRFGPFPGGVINIGTDTERCQIAINLPGVASVHAMVTDHGDGRFTIQPAERGAEVGLAMSVAGRARAVQNPTQARSGEVLVIGGDSGARFTLEHQAEKRQRGGPAGVGGRYASQGGFANAMGNEVKRQAMSNLIAKTPLRNYWTDYQRLRNGTFMQPRYLVTFLGGLVVVLGGAAMTCAGGIGTLIAALSHR